MDKPKVLVITHGCIEGHTAAAIFGRCFGKNEDIISNGFSSNFRYHIETAQGWINYLTNLISDENSKNLKTEQKPYIFITDLHIPESKRHAAETKKLLDLINKRGKVFLIDHHKTGEWLMKDSRIEAYVVKADSACELVFRNLATNFLDEKTREKFGETDKYIKLPKELKDLMISNLSEDFIKQNEGKRIKSDLEIAKAELFKFLNYKNNPGIISKMNDIDSGRGGHGALKFAFHADKIKYMKWIAEKQYLTLSKEQEEKYEKANRIKEQKILKFLKESKFKIKMDYNDRIFILGESPQDNTICVNDIFYKIEKVFEREIGDVGNLIDYFALVRTNQINPNDISVSLRSFNLQNADMDSIAATYGGGGHDAASGFKCHIDSGKLTYDKDKKRYVTKELETDGKTIAEISAMIKKALQVFSGFDRNNTKEKRNKTKEILIEGSPQSLGYSLI